MGTVVLDRFRMAVRPSRGASVLFLFLFHFTHAASFLAAAGGSTAYEQERGQAGG